MNRRVFIGGLAFASQVTGANDRVTLALIGGRNQGRAVALRAIQAGAQVKTFCDLDPSVLEITGVDLNARQDRMPGLQKDYRHVLEDKDIDGVIIATPDHWHAIQMIDSCAAGKDVYCETPLCHTIHEGHAMQAAARKHNRVVQVGTHGRSGEHFKSAVEYVASGNLGKVPLIKAWINQVRPSIGRPPNGAPPTGMDYDRWLGPAPLRAFNQNRFHYNWRFFWDYGNGELGNQGINVLDVSLWAIQLMHGFDNFQCLPKRISSTGGIHCFDDAKEVPGTEVVSYDYGHTLLSFELRSFAVDHRMPGNATDVYTAFYGTDGTLLLGDAGWEVHRKDGTVKPKVHAGPMLHEANFLECIQSRAKPHSDIEIGRLSTTLCQLGNVSYKLGRDVKLDPKTETFPDDKQANALLNKQYRKGYPLPQV